MTTAGRNRVLVVFVDAFGPQQLARFGDELSTLAHRRPLEGVIGFSSGALASVLTGAPPAAHGRMCLFTARSGDAPSILQPMRWLGLLPRVVHERGKVRSVAARVLKKTAGLTGYVALHRVPPEEFHWLDLPERDDLFQTDDVGGTRTFLADAREAGLSVYAAPWQLPEPERWRVAHEALRRLQPDLAFLYAAELDGALHAGGNRGSPAGEATARIGVEIERAREEMLRGGGQLTTIVVGDHGMADVDTFVDPRAVVRELGTRAFVDSTMLRVWGDDASVDRARARLESASWPGRWLGEDDLRAREAPVDGAPYGRGMFLLDEGAIFAPSWVGGRVAGMHGYDVRCTSARAALASDQPVPPHVRAITDVASIVRERLGLDAEGTGSPRTERLEVI